MEVNGHVDDAGEFIVEYIKGIDNEFSRTERDTWMLYLTQWINITIDANGESLVISDEHHAGFFPEGAAIRTDQTVRPFVAQAKYMAGNGSDGKAASISGVNAAHDQSHNGMITRFKAKGTQYCGTTAQDKNHMDNLFEVAFATRNSQSIMSGCTGYYNRFYATVVENNVERIIISKSDAIIPGKAIITPPRIIPFLPKFLLPIEEAISMGKAPGVRLATIISLSKFSLVSSLFSPTKTSSKIGINALPPPKPRQPIFKIFNKKAENFILLFS